MPFGNSVRTLKSIPGMPSSLRVAIDDGFRASLYAHPCANNSKYNYRQKQQSNLSVAQEKAIGDSSSLRRWLLDTEGDRM